MNVPLELDHKVLNIERWKNQIQSLTSQYQSASPYPHIVLDDFFESEAVSRALDEFPSFHKGDWIHYLHANEKKYGNTRFETFGPSIKAIIEEVHSPAFLDFLKQMTGIEGLMIDKKLEGGGLHQSARGGFLNIHADFTVHPHHRNWKRRLNLLLYLNRNWEDSYGGHLELWDRKMKTCVKKIAPIFNRCVIFNTDEDAFHGHPEPLKCPPNMTRKSIALYYFTNDKTRVKVRSTEYRARPGDKLKGLAIYADKMALRLYDKIKRTLRLDDKHVSNLLKQAHRMQKKNRRIKSIRRARKKK